MVRGKLVDKFVPPIIQTSVNFRDFEELLGTLSKDVFEQRTSTGSEALSLFTCLDANKFVLLNFFSLIKTIDLRVPTKPLPNDAKSPLPVDVRRSKTLLLKLPILCFHSRSQHLCKFIGTKESVYLRKEFNSHRTGLGHKHGRRFIVLGHKYGRYDVM